MGLGANDTVNHLVNNINKSGIAKASVDSSDQLTVVGIGSGAITMVACLTTTGKFAADTTETAKLTGGAAFTMAGGTSAQCSALIDLFDNLGKQGDAAAKDAGFNGTNLLVGDNLTIAFNE